MKRRARRVKVSGVQEWGCGRGSTQVLREREDQNQPGIRAFQGGKKGGKYLLTFGHFTCKAISKIVEEGLTSVVKKGDEYREGGSLENPVGHD